MNKILCLLLLFSIGLHPATAQSNNTINWMSWSQLKQALNNEPKPVFIFFHAEWCAYCKKIEREIFTYPDVINKLNTSYYAVEMDVETTEIIEFDGIKFTNKQAIKQRNGVHEIPLLLASREQKPFTLPATIILDKDFKVIERFFEYYTSKKLLKAL